MSMAQTVETAILSQTRRGLRTLLAVPAARAAGLARVEDLAIPAPAGDLRARYYEANGAIDAPLMVYFHGGGFVCCDIDTHDSICSWLAKSSQGRVLSVDYRLAPETPFPGQIEDVREQKRSPATYIRNGWRIPYSLEPATPANHAGLYARSDRHRGRRRSQARFPSDRR